MRFALCALGGAALTAIAATPLSAQESAWAYFEGEGGLMQAGVQSANGEQLILKCDEPGDGEVFAVIYTPTRLKPPSARPQMRDVRMRFDEGPPFEDSWRHYEQTAMALNTRRDQQLGDFLNRLADANNLEVILDPVDGSVIEVKFVVTGTREAAARVFESCQDGDNPLG